MSRLKLSVIAIGGVHQFLHFIPLALKLAERGRIVPEIFVANAAERDFVVRLATSLASPLPQITVMTTPGRWRFMTRMKSGILIAWAQRLRGADLMLSAERTSTLLTRLPGRKPPFVHIPHGAGDRAKGFEKRIARFDKALVSGEKDRARIVAAGLLPANAVAAIGSVKLAALALMPPPAPVFANDLPTILYNPHFSKALGTFDEAAENLIRAIAHDPRYNLIVAPHVRLAERLSEDERKRFESHVSDRILIDFGSLRSIDMTYSRAADIYVGDVSSQVYEALAMRKRPCLFLAREEQAWAADPDYAMWHFGPVVDCRAPILPAIEDALARFPTYRAVQDAAIERAYADSPYSAGSLAAMAERAEAIMLALAPTDR